MLKNEFIWMYIFLKTTIIKILLFFKCIPINKKKFKYFHISTTMYELGLRYKYILKQPMNGVWFNDNIIKGVNDSYTEYLTYLKNT